MGCKIDAVLPFHDNLRGNMFIKLWYSYRVKGFTVL